jgi:ribosomal protein S7
VPLHPRRQTILALKWLVLSIKVNKFSSLEKRMTSEFVELAKKRKTILWKRYLDHLAEINDNRMNNRFRWEQ